MRISGGSGERARELDVYERRLPNDRQQAIVFLRGPAEVRNVAFLSLSTPGKAADQWLYLPALRRVRQITASTRNEPFVSSDLTFHDLDLLSEIPSWSESDATSTLRGEERVADIECHTIELRPQRDDIGYRRIVLWLGRDDLVPRRVDFHADAPATGWLGLGGSSPDAPPTKRLQQSGISFDGKIPVARQIDVETPANGSRTAIEIVAVEHDRGLPESLFTQRALEVGPPAAGGR
jgi:hypothetical protein